MSELAIHPQFVHLPLALGVLMPFLTGGLLFAWWRGWLPKRTWVMAIAAQAVLLASALVASKTGEADEDAVERIVPKAAIETHEAAGTALVWGSGVVLVLVLLPLFLQSARAARAAALGAVAGTIVVLLLGLRAGAAGGDLVYRHGAAGAFAPGLSGQPAVQPRNHDHDR